MIELEMSSLHKQRSGDGLDFWDNVNLRRLYKRTFIALRLRSDAGDKKQVRCKLNIILISETPSSSAPSSTSPLLNSSGGTPIADKLSSVSVNRMHWSDGSSIPVGYNTQGTNANRQVEFTLCSGSPVVLELQVDYRMPKRVKKPRFMFQLLIDDRLVTSWCALILHRSGSCGAMGSAKFSTGSLFRLLSPSGPWVLVSHPVSQHSNDHPLLRLGPALSDEEGAVEEEDDEKFKEPKKRKYRKRPLSPSSPSPSPSPSMFSSSSSSDPHDSYASDNSFLSNTGLYEVSQAVFDELVEAEDDERNTTQTSFTKGPFPDRQMNSIPSCFAPSYPEHPEYSYYDYVPRPLSAINPV